MANKTKMVRKKPKGQGVSVDLIAGAFKFEDLLAKRAAKVAKKAKKAQKAIKKPVRPHTVAKASRRGFYKTQEWASVRYEALKNSGGCCELCGGSSKEGVILNVDHIKPLHKYPELALDVSNLQCLCSLCNRGKWGGDETDWRDLEGYHLPWGGFAGGLKSEDQG